MGERLWRWRPNPALPPFLLKNSEDEQRGPKRRDGSDLCLVPKPKIGGHRDTAPGSVEVGPGTSRSPASGSAGLEDSNFCFFRTTMCDRVYAHMKRNLRLSRASLRCSRWAAHAGRPWTSKWEKRGDRTGKRTRWLRGFQRCWFPSCDAQGPSSPFFLASVV